MTDADDAAASQDAARVLELRHVHAGYDGVRVLHDVSLAVTRGEVLALLGSNGAGKSTLLKVAGGRLSPTHGSVWLDGRDVTGASPEQLVRMGVCTIPEGRGVFPNLTVAENLQMWTYGGASRRDVEEVAYTRFPRLGERTGQLAGTLSGGEQQMLAMSRVLSTNPRVLLLDEISMGLAPTIVAELYGIVAQLVGEGRTILLVEQFAHTALEIANRAAIVTQGRVAVEGTPADVAAALGDAYFRGSAS
jgi:branched-chain amino acid transport system ATP-binding protein